MGNPSVHLANPGSRFAFDRQTTITSTTNNHAETMLTARMFEHPAPVMRSHMRNHRLFQLAERAPLLRKNSHHPSVPNRANGRLIAIQVPAAAHARWIPRSGSLLRNLPTTNGITNRAGYSFAAAPSPSKTPDHPSRRRKYANVPAVASATAIRSQLFVA